MPRLVSLIILTLMLAPSAVLGAPLTIAENLAALKSRRPPSDGSFTFAVLGDSRGGDDIYRALLLQALGLDVAFILHSGDLTNSGTDEEFAAYAKLIEDIPVPILHVAGNHDIRSGREPYWRCVGTYNWVFDYGGYRFLGLDNPGMRFGQREFDFVYRHLDPSRPTFVMYHTPQPFERWTVHAMMFDDENGRGTEMHAQLKQGGVKAVFLGHIHLHDHMHYDGIDYYISGASGAPLYRNYGFGRAEYGLLLVRVTPDQVEYEWVVLAPVMLPPAI